ncbi:unnamed protein product [Cuscuta epithymum]|uniref:Uncharacterized protein n=1 Tax=Cuscuta epithymum TaxID=186058 RepID=A0AAV0DIE3_9ASTE|nr:unnamed protein product [Cuscuta epithymum]
MGLSDNQIDHVAIEESFTTFVSSAESHVGIKLRAPMRLPEALESVTEEVADPGIVPEAETEIVPEAETKIVPEAGQEIAMFGDGSSLQEVGSLPRTRSLPLPVLECRERQPPRPKSEEIRSRGMAEV